MDLITEAIMEVAHDGSPESVKRISIGAGLPSWAIRRAKPAEEHLGPSSRMWARWQEDVVRAHLGLLTQQELDRLRESVPSPHALDDLGCLSLPEIGQRIGRSANAVKVKLVRKGWRPFLRNPQWLTASDVGEAMGVDSHSVAKWIERGYLEADGFPYDGRVVHRVRREDLRRFIIDPESWVYYRVEKIADSGLRELALSIRDGHEYLSTGQVARRLQCSTGWIATMIGCGMIPAKRWGNYYIHRDDAARVELPGPGHPHLPKGGFSPAEDLCIALARSVGVGYGDLGLHLNRHLGVLSYRWSALGRNGIGTLIGDDEAILSAGRRILGS